MNRKNPKVDGYFRKAKKWQKEMEKLRKIMLDCQLTEELKWAKPCYMFEKSNVVIICGLKESCALGFLKGSLLKDAKGVLGKPGENSQSMRWLKFSDAQEIKALEPVIKAYIQEAIAVEKAGLEVTYKKTSDFTIPEELQNKLDKNAALKAAFHALTPGRQRGYLLYFSAPKQSKTRESRIEKCVPQILAGKGLHDEYRATRK
jgi:uncharacterized protein YdeI (YjbR/CyaY-like superfamily)